MPKEIIIQAVPDLVLYWGPDTTGGLEISILDAEQISHGVNPTVEQLDHLIKTLRRARKSVAQGGMPRP